MQKVFAVTINYLIGALEEKIKFVFSIYDMDRDGYISNGELFKVFKGENKLT